MTEGQQAEAVAGGKPHQSGSTSHWDHLIYAASRLPQMISPSANPTREQKTLSYIARRVA